MTTSSEKMQLDSQDKNVLYIVEVGNLEGVQQEVAIRTLAWKQKSDGNFPVTGDTITAFGKQFMVVGTFGNKILVKASLDGKGVNEGERVGTFNIRRVTES